MEIGLLILAWLRRCLGAVGRDGIGSNGPAQQVDELMDARFFALPDLTLAPEEAGIEFFGQQSVLETFDRPVENRNDHFQVEILPEFSALEAKFYECNRAVGVLGHVETVDLTLKRQIGSIVPEQGDAIRNPIFMEQMLGSGKPVAQDFEESPVPDLLRSVEIGGEGADGFFVDLEEQTVLADEMLEDRAFGDAKLGRYVGDAGGVITLLGEVAHGDVDDARAFRFRARTGRDIVAVAWWTDQTAADSAHEVDLKSRNDIGK